MKISALNEIGKPVDWWFAYKVPKMTKTPHSVAATGYEYFYFDPAHDKVIQSPNLMNDGKGALDLTLDSVFNKPSDTTGWILYNDEMPSDTKRKNSGSYGHTKGIITFDTATKTGYWLLHSWPKFSDPGSEEMPTPIYGQTFFCISIDLDTAAVLAHQMINHQEPQVYRPRVPITLSKTDPLHMITRDVDSNAVADSDAIECTSRGGMKFKVIAKNRKWGKDFWNDLVGPTLKSDMDDETWIRGAIPPTLDSDGKHKTFDVKFIDFTPLGYSYSWPETHDHAKWGLTTSSDWICVGDINRMISQEKRGGGTIAFQNKKLWEQLKKTDLLVPPKGQSVEDVKKAIKKTHIKI